MSNIKQLFKNHAKGLTSAFSFGMGVAGVAGPLGLLALVPLAPPMTATVAGVAGTCAVFAALGMFAGSFGIARRVRERFCGPSHLYIGDSTRPFLAGFMVATSVAAGIYSAYQSDPSDAVQKWALIEQAPHQTASLDSSLRAQGLRLTRLNLG